MIMQLTVFLENSEGRLAALCRTLADANINMSALTIAETSDYGIVRIICDNVFHAVDVLEESGFRATKTKVLAVEVPDRPGALAELLEALGSTGVNIEYGYCFLSDGNKAIDVLKIKPQDRPAAEAAITSAGFKLLHWDDIAS
ncbi:MAG: ACT domain-containing protein [Atopobiaceae bacterium]|nr:ACT domain-containing protein [Atopobiaceae bacterium]MDO4403458.1 ACT domain-containing protein [Atopobiaceae bacterium]